MSSENMPQREGSEYRPGCLRNMSIIDKLYDYVNIKSMWTWDLGGVGCLFLEVVGAGMKRREGGNMSFLIYLWLKFNLVFYPAFASTWCFCGDQYLFLLEGVGDGRG